MPDLPKDPNAIPVGTHGGADDASGDAGSTGGAPAGGPSAAGPDGGQGGNADRGFPENTPIADMTAEQQAAYWKFHDRRKSDTLRAYGGITPEQAAQYKKDAEDARRAQLQPSERALEDAKTAAAAAATAAAAQQWAPTMAKAVIGQFITDEAQRDAVLSGINPSAFVGDDGAFDTDRLIGHLTGLQAAFGNSGAGGGSGEQPPRQWGQHGSHPPANSGRDEGLAEARRRGYIK